MVRTRKSRNMGCCSICSSQGDRQAREKLKSLMSNLYFLVYSQYRLCQDFPSLAFWHPGPGHSSSWEAPRALQDVSNNSGPNNPDGSSTALLLLPPHPSYHSKNVSRRCQMSFRDKKWLCLSTELCFINQDLWKLLFTLSNSLFLTRNSVKNIIYSHQCRIPT